MQELVVLLLLFMVVGTTRVCKTFTDYYTNEHCYNDPDGERDVPEIVRSRGYPIERYEVVTEDGYILTLFRIPSKGKGIPVFLQHGVNLSSLGWFAAGNDSLAFLLWNAGYDVWLGNFRGTIYSQTHKTLSINDARFWNFGFQELGIYDTYSQLSFVANKTGSKVRYIGESLGTTTAFVFSILRAEESVELVEIMLQVTPVVYTTGIKSSVVLVARLSPIFVPILNATLKGVFFKQTPLYRWFYRHALTLYPFQMKLYFFVAMTIVGFDWEQINQELAPVQILQSHDAICIKLIYHFFINHIRYNGRFLYYDYGPVENERIYGSRVPPSYNLSKIQVPNYLIYGENDLVGSKENVMRLYNDLPAIAKKYGYWAPDDEKFMHTDFMIAKDVKSLAYNHIIEFLNNL